MDLDPVLLAQLQFAFSISFHILFPAFTIGLAAWIVVLEALWLTSGSAVHGHLSRAGQNLRHVVRRGRGIRHGHIIPVRHCFPCDAPAGGQDGVRMMRWVP